MSTLTKKTAVALTAALIAFGAAGTAQAHHHHHDGKQIFIIGTHKDCGFYKYQWLTTGSPFWKWKFFECRRAW